VEKSKEKENNLLLSPILITKYKIGIYRELHKKGLLTLKQLDALIKLQKKEVNFPIE